jgi:hypothetical protein
MKASDSPNTLTNIKKLTESELKKYIREHQSLIKKERELINKAEEVFERNFVDDERKANVGKCYKHSNGYSSEEMWDQYDIIKEYAVDNNGYGQYRVLTYFESDNESVIELVFKNVGLFMEDEKYTPITEEEAQVALNSVVERLIGTPYGG